MIISTLLIGSPKLSEFKCFCGDTLMALDSNNKSRIVYVFAERIMSEYRTVTHP